MYLYRGLPEPSAIMNSVYRAPFFSPHGTLRFRVCWSECWPPLPFSMPTQLRHGFDILSLQLSLLDVCPQVPFYVLAMKLAARHLAFKMAVMATLSFWSRVFIRVLWSQLFRPWSFWSRVFIRVLWSQLSLPWSFWSRVFIGHLCWSRVFIRVLWSQLFLPWCRGNDIIIIIWILKLFIYFLLEECPVQLFWKRITGHERHFFEDIFSLYWITFLRKLFVKLYSGWSPHTSQIVSRHWLIPLHRQLLCCHIQSHCLLVITLHSHPLWRQITFWRDVAVFHVQILGTLRSRTGERTTAHQRTVRTGPRSPSHAMDE